MSTKRATKARGNVIELEPAALEPQVVESSSKPLYVVEADLAAFLDTADMAGPELEAQFEAELQAALTTAVDKRDNVGRFMAHLDAQVEFADAEIERLRQRRAVYQAALDRMESYIVRIIEGLRTDSRGRFQKLEGQTFTFALRACPPSVDIREEMDVPDAYKTAGVRMPVELWAEVLDALELELRGRLEDATGRPNFSTSRLAIKRAIQDGRKVPGADLIVNKHTLNWRGTTPRLTEG
jgi:hypothetical protein